MTGPPSLTRMPAPHGERRSRTRRLLAGAGAAGLAASLGTCDTLTPPSVPAVPELAVVIEEDTVRLLAGADSLLSVEVRATDGSGLTLMDPALGWTPPGYVDAECRLQLTEPMAYLAVEARLSDEGVQARPDTVMVGAWADVDVRPDTGIHFVALPDTFRATAVALDAAGQAHPEWQLVVSWSSSDNAIASVDAGGLITANGNGGPVAIRASTADAADSITVEVRQLLAGISGPIQVDALEDTIDYAAVDPGDNDYQRTPVRYASSDPAVMTIDSLTGRAVSLANGTTELAAVTADDTARLTVTVAQVVNSVDVTPASLDFTMLSDTARLSVEAYDRNGVAAAGQATWWSLDESVATVDGSGLVTAVGNGTTDVGADIDGVSDAATVTVDIAVASVVVTPAVDTLRAVGDTVRLSAVARDSGGTTIPGATFTWTSSNTGVATVDTAGLVTATTNGTTDIVAATGGVADTAAITVEIEIGVIEVVPALDTLTAIDDTVRLQATAKDPGGTEIPGISFAWSTGDAAIASVSAQGLVRAIANGTVDITASASGTSGTASITVEQAIAGIDVDTSGVTISGVGTTWDFDVTAVDANGYPVTGSSPPAVTWSSLNPNVATVDASGVATAVAAGQVAIAADYQGDAYYALLHVVVPGLATVNLWTRDSSPTSADFEDLWAASPDTAIAVGDAGAAVLWDGTSWVTSSTSTSSYLKGVSGLNSGDVYAAGSYSGLHFDGSTWTSIGSGCSSYDIWAATPDAVFSTGSSGCVSRYDGSSWNGMSTSSSYSMRTAWGSDVDDLYVAGFYGSLWHHDGESWTSIGTGSSGTAEGIWGSGRDDVFVVDSWGAIVHYDGTSWTEQEDFTYSIYGIWGAAPDDVYAVGGNGILHYDGAGWSVLVTKADLGPTLNGIHGTSDGPVFVAGDNGAIFRGFRNATVSISPSADTLTLVEDTTRLVAEARDGNNDLIGGNPFTWSSSDTGVATVDGTGLVTAVGNGTATITAEAYGGLSVTAAITVDIAVASIDVSPAVDTLTAIADTVRCDAEARDAGGSAIGGISFTWSSSDTAVASVSAQGLVRAKANGTASIEASASGQTGSASITVEQVVVGVAVDTPGVTLSGAGATWDFDVVPADANGYEVTGATPPAVTWSSLNPHVATIDASGVATAGAAGQVAVAAEYDSDAAYAVVNVVVPGLGTVNLWTRDPSPGTADLNGVWAASPDSAFAVGDAGTIFHWDGASWSSASIGTTQDFEAVSGLSATHVYAAGDWDPTRRFDGTSWSSIGDMCSSHYSIWAATPDAVFDVGSSGCVYRYDGSAWTDMDPATTNSLRSVGGSAATDFYVGGYNTLWRYAGNTWTSIGSSVTYLYDIWASGPDDVFAVGSSGDVLHYDGSGWSTMDTGEYNTLNGIWGGAPDDVYAVGSSGLVLYYDGTSWSTLVDDNDLGLGYTGLKDVYGTSDGPVFAVGDDGALFRGFRDATVSISPGADTLTQYEDTTRIVAEARDDQGALITGNPFTWSSSDTAVAKVDATGLVTAYASGTATITADAYGGLSVSATITVNIPGGDPVTPLPVPVPGPGDPDATAAAPTAPTKVPDRAREPPAATSRNRPARR